METSTIVTEDMEMNVESNGQVTLDQLLEGMEVTELPKGVQAKLERKKKLEQMLAELDTDVVARVERVKAGGGKRGSSHPLAKSPTRQAFNAFFKAMDTLGFPVVIRAFEFIIDSAIASSEEERQGVYEYLVDALKARALQENEEQMQRNRENAQETSASSAENKKGGNKAKK